MKETIGDGIFVVFQGGSIFQSALVCSGIAVGNRLYIPIGKDRPFDFGVLYTLFQMAVGDYVPLGCELSARGRRSRVSLCHRKRTRGGYKEIAHAIPARDIRVLVDRNGIPSSPAAIVIQFEMMRWLERSVAKLRCN